MEAMDRQRTINHKFREANLNAIHEAEVENFDREIQASRAAQGRGAQEQSALEKLAPLLDTAGKVWQQHVAVRQAERKARYEAAHNMLVATKLTTKQRNEAFALEEAIRNEATEGIQALKKINDELGLVGENALTAQNISLLKKHSGEHALYIKPHLAINSFQKFDTYIRANQHLVDEET